MMQAVPLISLREAAGVWARIALLSFGGPAGQIALMHRELVERRRWVGEQPFLHALNYCMLLPGPEAQQLATYIGWMMHGTRGGIIAGGLFILPGLVALMALSVVYASFREASLVAALLFGLKAAVLAIVIDAVVRIGRRALRSAAARLVALSAFTAIFFFALPFPLVMLAAAAAGLAGLVPAHAPSTDRSGPEPAPVTPAQRRSAHRAAAVFLMLWLAPVAGLLLWLGRGDVFTEIALFFSRMAVVTFGGAYAVLAYVAQQAVGHYDWLTSREMLDGLGMAETTPGPLILVTQFVGFLAASRFATGLPPMVAGMLGGLLTSWVTFMPCFVWIFLGAPYIERLRGNRALAAGLAAITAAVVGVIISLALWFAVHFLFGAVTRIETGPFDFDTPVAASVDLAAVALAAAAALAILRFKWSPLFVLAGCCAAGVLVRLGV